MLGIGKISSRVSSSARFGRKITLIKTQPGSRVDGRYVPGVEEQVDIIANVQPYDEDVRDNLPEGIRITETKLVVIETNNPDLVRPARQGNVQTSADRFLIDGKYYIVAKVPNYADANHLECICVRIEDQDG